MIRGGGGGGEEEYTWLSWLMGIYSKHIRRFSGEVLLSYPAALFLWWELKLLLAYTYPRKEERER